MIVVVFCHATEPWTEFILFPEIAPCLLFQIVDCLPYSLAERSPSKDSDGPVLGDLVCLHFLCGTGFNCLCEEKQPPAGVQKGSLRNRAISHTSIASRESFVERAFRELEHSASKGRRLKLRRHKGILEKAKLTLHALKTVCWYFVCKCTRLGFWKNCWIASSNIPDC